MEPKHRLTQFDLTNIIVGAIVGADIYIASALTAGLVGPFSIVVWMIAGVFAGIIAMVFAYCSFYVPHVGGPFAYVSAALDQFYGFLTGWSLWIAELMALPVFAIAFVLYLQSFVTLNPEGQIVVRALFIGTLTLVNIIGVKAAGRFNDVLTVVKLFPLILLILAGLLAFVTKPEAVAANYTPLLPLGFQNVGYAVVLVFWAYVGFEMGTFPASEVEKPRSTIPRAIINGMAIVGLFYILTNFVLYGLINWTVLTESKTPLVLAGTILFGTAGAAVMTIGALLSVSGSDESGMLGTSRLAYAMALDGLLPRIFARLHPRFGTPYAILILQGAIAFLLSGYGSLSELISFSVFNIAFAYLLTCIALIVLVRHQQQHLVGQRILPLIGIAICTFLLYSTTLSDKIAGTLVILAGIPFYIYFSPKEDIHHLKRLFLTEEAVLLRQVEIRNRYLGNIIRLLHLGYQRILVWMRSR